MPTGEINSHVIFENGYVISSKYQLPKVRINFRDLVIKRFPAVYNNPDEPVQQVIRRDFQSIPLCGSLEDDDVPVADILFASGAESTIAFHHGEVEIVHQLNSGDTSVAIGRNFLEVILLHLDQHIRSTRQ